MIDDVDMTCCRGGFRCIVRVRGARLRHNEGVPVVVECLRHIDLLKRHPLLEIHVLLSHHSAQMCAKLVQFARDIDSSRADATVSTEWRLCRDLDGLICSCVLVLLDPEGTWRE